MAASDLKQGNSPSIGSLEKDGFQDNSDVDSTHHKGTFDTINNSSLYKPIEQYEGMHRYDPKFQWEPKEEQRLVRKVVDFASCTPHLPTDSSLSWISKSALLCV